MGMPRSVFTSESVSEGHPDKVCDQIADAVLDEFISRDPRCHVACEVFASASFILIGGETSLPGVVDVQKIARDVARDIGYTNIDFGLDCESMAVLNMMHSQSADINQGVSGEGLEEFRGQQGAGDQGIMFGFACNETEHLMPAPVSYAHSILRTAAALRKSGAISWLRPDAKSQVTVQYENGKPSAIDTVVVSHQHNPEVSYDEIKETIIEKIIRPALEETDLLRPETKYFINPTGRFVIGGPFGDTGLTGRKIIVDTYGGMGHHGGGAFSGKDPSKVDRSASYMARYAAKNVVAAGLADRCELEIAYAIGVPFPVSVMADTFGTGKVPDERLAKAVSEVFDFSPAGIAKTLDLNRPIYRKCVNYGHFGRPDVPWEKTDKAEELQRAVR